MTLEAVKIKDLPNTLNKVINNDIYLPKDNQKRLHGKIKKNGNTFEISIDEAFNFTFKLKSINTIEYKFSIQPEKMNDISDVVHILKLAKGLSSGSIFINGIKLIDFKLNSKMKKDIEMLSMLIDYWEKIEQIAQQLKEYYNIILLPKDIVKNSDTDVFNFEVLNRSLIDKKPYKLNNVLIDGFSLITNDNADIPKMKDTATSFTFLREESFIFAGKEFTVYVTTGIFNIIISEITFIQKNNDGTSKYYFKLSPKNKKIDIYERIFLDKHIAQEYLNDKHFIDELSKATNI